MWGGDFPFQIHFNSSGCMDRKAARQNSRLIPKPSITANMVEGLVKLKG